MMKLRVTNLTFDFDIYINFGGEGATLRVKSACPLSINPARVPIIFSCSYKVAKCK